MWSGWSFDVVDHAKWLGRSFDVVDDHTRWSSRSFDMVYDHARCSGRSFDAVDHARWFLMVDQPSLVLILFTNMAADLD